MAIDRRNTGGFMPLRDAMDRLFAESFITPTGTSGGWPPADLYTNDNDVVVEMSVPGANPDDIHVSVTGDSLTVSGDINREHQTKKGQEPYIHEIWHGKFQRSFTLPTEVDSNKADATFHNGILVVTMPKSEATKPRKIEVKAGQGKQQTIEGKASQTGQSNLQTEQVPVQSGSGSSSKQSSSGSSSQHSK